MKPNDSITISARPAHGPGPAGVAGNASSAGDPALDAFAALLDGLCPDSGQPLALSGAAVAEDPAAPAKGRKAPAAPDTALPDAFFLQVPPGLATPLATGAAPTSGSASPTGPASLRDAGTDGAKGNAAAGFAAAAANDMHSGAAEAAPARPGAFQALLVAATPAATEAVRAEATPAGIAADALASALPSALAGVHGAPAPDAAAPALPVHQAALPSHPQSPAFAGDLGAELRWMVEAGLQQAELHLNPAELGPIQVQLSLQAQTAEIHFAAAHATTRDSIQQALPVLREMLAGEGLQLGQAGVSGGGAGQEFAQAQAQERATRAAAGPAAAAAGTPAPRATPRAGRGMLDLYA